MNTQENNDKLINTLGCCLGLGCFLPFFLVCLAFVIHWSWGLVLVPVLGVPAISVWQSIALVILIFGFSLLIKK